MRTELIHQVQAALGPHAARSWAAASQYLAAAIAHHLFSCEASPEALKQAFRADRRTTIGRLLPRAAAWLDNHLSGCLATLRAAGLLSTACPDQPFTAAQYQERVVHLALEQVLVNPAAPPLLVSPVPDPECVSLLAVTPAVAILFDYPLAITHELYPLGTDAYVYSLSEPAILPFRLIGVHNAWIDAVGRATRLICFLPEQDLFIETPLPAPLPLAAGLLLCQSAGSHQTLAARLTAAGVPHLNPREPAVVADDKWQCYERWQNAGVSTPPTCLIRRDASLREARQTALAFIHQHTAYRHGWVIQPRRGTEGAQVTWVSPAPGAAENLLHAWETIAAADDAILRPRIGLVCLQTPEGPRPFDLRLHVVADRAGWAVESGYLQVAPAIEAPISSMARGGQIQPFARLAEAELVCLEDPTAPPRRWTPAAFDAAGDLAARAAQAAGPLGLAGVDLKFDYRDGRLHPAVLDLNPRPAGLLHANLFASGEAGIGPALWRYLLSLTTSSACLSATRIPEYGG